MTLDIEKDPTDAGTLRPNIQPLKEAGQAFIPMEIPDFDVKIMLPEGVSINNPITIFLLYYPRYIIDRIVLYTNQFAIEVPDELRPRSKKKPWFPTTAAEIYIFLAIRIYMTRHPENKASDYWATTGIKGYHQISQYMARDRFNQLYLRYRYTPYTTKDVFEKIDPLSEHIQKTNLQLWQPGRDLAIDEAIERFTGRSKEKTTIPNKPTPTGLKIWVAAQKGFFLVWNWHRPGKQNGPIRVQTPKELGGNKNGKGGNKTQAVVPHLLAKLPPAQYHVFLDNLFTSTPLFELLRSIGFAATGTCRTNSGVVSELVEQKKGDKGKEELAWGTQISLPTKSEKVLQTGWKDNAFALTMTTFFDGKKQVLRTRKRPRESSSKARTARKPFGELATKELLIPEIYDEYNHHMGSVDIGDQLKAHNKGQRPIRRGGAKVLDQFLLTTVLVNIFLILRYSGEASSLNLRSQDATRDAIIGSLLALGKQENAPKKRSYSGTFGAPILKSVSSYNHVKISNRRDCAACKGARFGDRPTKRVALSEIAANSQRNSVRRSSVWACQECNVSLCKNSNCFTIYHSI